MQEELMDSEFQDSESKGSAPNRVGEIPVFTRNASLGGRGSLPKLNKFESQPANSNKIPDTDIEELSSEQSQLTEIRTEIGKYAKEVLTKVEAMAELAKTNLSIPQGILKELMDISAQLTQNTGNDTEFGIGLFKRYVELIGRHKKITSYELRRSNLIQNLLLFIFSCTVQKRVDTPLVISPQKSKSEEHKLTSPSAESSQTRFMENKNKPALDITDSQSKTIVARMIAFLDAFKTRSPDDPSRNLLLSPTSH